MYNPPLLPFLIGFGILGLGFDGMGWLDVLEVWCGFVFLIGESMGRLIKVVCVMLVGINIDVDVVTQSCNIGSWTRKTREERERERERERENKCGI
jgi:hypothetical protein